MVFEIRSDDEKLGELRISRGTFDWAQSNANIPIQLTWEQFDRSTREVGPTDRHEPGGLIQGYGSSLAGPAERGLD